MSDQTTGEIFAQEQLRKQIEDLNIQLAAQENYKKYGLWLGLAMLIIKLFKR